MKTKQFASFMLVIFLMWTLLFLVLLTTTPSSYYGTTVSDPRVDSIQEGIARLNHKLNQSHEQMAKLWKDLAKLIEEDFDANTDIHNIMKSLEHTTTAKPKVVYESRDPIAVLVMACNRPDAILNHLEQLLRYRPSAEKFPVIVSQDCNNPKVTSALKPFGRKVIHLRHPDEALSIPPKEIKAYHVYYKVARHFGWALNYTLNTLNYDKVIITEDDLDISADFFEYFSATSVLLDRDDTLWCVSAWNDNGKLNTIDLEQSALLHRTDFFPGLGWMLSRRLWREELSQKWPKAFWDDWMRVNDQRKDRSCIYPEVSRTAMSPQGQSGASQGLFYETHLKHVLLNKRATNFTQMDLSYLLKSDYDSQFLNDVYSAPGISSLSAENLQTGNTVRLTYTTANEFHLHAKILNLMNDFRSGVPRTAYLGVVQTLYKGVKVYLAPPQHQFTGYNSKWN